ncbi:MAG: M48 family metallopeptidase, partial [Thermodesulfobacteriota bacterium]|nr:M48 family metallopeptidase [Thermodesulfobacteriota bacterium]
MFNNIIYFIIVLLIFNISFPGNSTENSLSYTLGMLFGCWLVFALYCRLGFKRLTVRFSGGKTRNENIAGEYQSLVLKLSMLSIFLFALDVYIFNLKYWLQIIPGLNQFSVLQGILALMLFIFYLSTIWYFAHPVYTVAFQAKLTRFSFIISNIKFNLPILFPWLIISLIIDLISFTPWSGPESFMNKPESQILFFACFIIVIMIFLPPLIQYWWGCRPFETSDRVKQLETFLHKMGFKYRKLLNWPIFEGRMMTAGIMGIVPRYRYILITDALMEILSLEELKAVMAHEMGHARYRHFLFYMFFFLGYIVIVIGLYPFLLYFLTAQPMLINALEGAGPQAATLFYLVLSVPVLITMIVYFRYVMGFFMRNFERQADLHSAVIMDGPRHTISSLEKIALLGG